VRYIDSRKDRWGVEPICRFLQFAPATYYVGWSLSGIPMLRSFGDTRRAACWLPYVGRD